MSTTYLITLTKSGKTLGETVFQTSVFDQPRIQARFDKWVRRLGEGDELEYSKVTKTHVHPAMLVVERLEGKLWHTDLTTRRRYTPKS